jgi:hypothetical protein
MDRPLRDWFEAKIPGHDRCRTHESEPETALEAGFGVYFDGKTN